MWVWVSLAVGCAATAAVYARRGPHDTQEVCFDLDAVTNVDSLVDMLKCLEKDMQTDDILEMIVDHVRDGGMSEGVLCNLSKLHRQHAHDQGINGFCINVTYSAVLRGLIDDQVVIVAD